MAFTRFEEDMNIIAALDDEPNDSGGMTAAQLKARFDEAGLRLQGFINDLIDEIASQGAAANVGVTPFTGVSDTNLQAALEKLQANILGVQAGTVSDGSITTAKLASRAVTDGKIAVGGVKTDNIYSGAVTSDKLAGEAVKTGKIENGAVTDTKLAAGSVTATKLAADAKALFYQTASGLPDNAVKTATIQNGAVKGAKLDLAQGGITTAVKLTKNVHYFDTLAEAPTTAGVLCFVKAED